MVRGLAKVDQLLTMAVDNLTRLRMLAALRPQRGRCESSRNHSAKRRHGRFCAGWALLFVKFFTYQKLDDVVFVL